MPELPLSGTVLDGFALWVAMLRPHEKDPSPYLERVAAAVQREVALDPSMAKWTGRVFVPARLLRAEPLEQWRQELLHGCCGGAIAGDLLLTLLELHAHAPKYATVRRAHHIVVQNLAEAQLGNGSKAPSSAKTVWNAWREFRPAAHLWGVLRSGLDLAHCWPKSPDRVPGFLALAEAFAERAEVYGIAAPGELWRCPAAVALPPVTVTVPPPTKWALARAREYRSVK
jgi:hypothetical protein